MNSQSVKRAGTCRRRAGQKKYPSQTGGGGRGEVRKIKLDLPVFSNKPPPPLNNGPSLNCDRIGDF